MPAIASGVSLSGSFTDGRLYAITTAPSAVGTCTIGAPALPSSSSLIGTSVAPKSTVLAMICFLINSTTYCAVLFALWKISVGGQPVLNRERGEIVPIITGTAHVNAESTLLLDDNDPFCWGIQS